MTKTQSQCDEASLKAMLRAEDSSADRDAIVSHLESCSKCQSRLVEMAADEKDWTKVAGILSSRSDKDDSLDFELEETLLPRLDRMRGQSEPWSEQMLRQLLDPPSHPEMLGRLGRYEIERLVGSGGMGIVFKAHDTELNRPVAIKMLAPYLASSGSARKRFAREARSAAGIVDDHVVPIHNVESESDYPFLVMQYVAGGSLQEKLDRTGPLSVVEIVRIGLQAAKGLAAAHSHGLIHRDVKPSNILLDEGVERALLTDFGLARTEDDACLTRSGFQPGTPHYMSPEQVRGESIDGRSDLFGLGCVMYALCTGRPPFRAESGYAVLRRITDDTPRSIREVNPDIPGWLEQLVMKLLEKDRDARFRSASEVVDTLSDWLAHAQQPSTIPAPKPPEPASSTGSRGTRGLGKYLMGAAGSLLLAFAGVLIFLEMSKGTIRIESEIDGVPIRIRKGDEIVESLTVSRSGESVRIAAGEYVVEVDAEINDLRIEDGGVSLSRGGLEVVRITEVGAGGFANDSGRTGRHESLRGKWRLQSSVIPGRSATAELSPGVVFFGEHTIRSQFGGDSAEYAYELAPNGELTTQAYRDGQLKDRVLGRLEVSQQHLYLALNVADGGTRFPEHARPQSVDGEDGYPSETSQRAGGDLSLPNEDLLPDSGAGKTAPGVRYFAFVREPWTDAEREATRAADRRIPDMAGLSVNTEFPEIQGRIIEIPSSQYGKLRISVGSDDGVRRGMHFDVQPREDEKRPGILRRISVDEVRESDSIAKILVDGPPDRRIQVGDTITSRDSVAASDLTRVKAIDRETILQLAGKWKPATESLRHIDSSLLPDEAGFEITIDKNIGDSHRRVSDNYYEPYSQGVIEQGYMPRATGQIKFDHGAEAAFILAEKHNQLHLLFGIITGGKPIVSLGLGQKGLMVHWGPDDSDSPLALSDNETRAIFYRRKTHTSEDVLKPAPAFRFTSIKGTDERFRIRGTTPVPGTLLLMVQTEFNAGHEFPTFAVPPGEFEVIFRPVDSENASGDAMDEVQMTVKKSDGSQIEGTISSRLLAGRQKSGGRFKLRYGFGDQGVIRHDNGTRLHFADIVDVEDSDTPVDFDKSEMPIYLTFEAARAKTGYPGGGGLERSGTASESDPTASSFSRRSAGMDSTDDVLRNIREGNPEVTVSVIDLTQAESLSKRLQGKWRLVGQVTDDGDAEALPKNATLEIQGDQFLFVDSNERKSATWTIDETTSPAHIDLKFDSTGKLGRGLISLDSEILILCLTDLDAPGATRPKTLEPRRGYWYMEFQRADSEGPKKDQAKRRMPNSRVSVLSRSPQIESSTEHAIPRAASSLPQQSRLTSILDLDGPADESGRIVGKVEGFPDDKRNITYSITLKPKTATRPKGEQDRKTESGPRSPAVVVSAGETFSFASVPAGAYTVKSVALIQSRKQIVGKSVEFDVEVVAVSEITIGIAFNSPADTSGWVESIRKIAPSPSVDTDSSGLPRVDKKSQDAVERQQQPTPHRVPSTAIAGLPRPKATDTAASKSESTTPLAPVALQEELENLLNRMRSASPDRDNAGPWKSRLDGIGRLKQHESLEWALLYICGENAFALTTPVRDSAGTYFLYQVIAEETSASEWTITDVIGSIPPKSFEDLDRFISSNTPAIKHRVSVEHEVSPGDELRQCGRLLEFDINGMALFESLQSLKDVRRAFLHEIDESQLRNAKTAQGKMKLRNEYITSLEAVIHQLTGAVQVLKDRRLDLAAKNSSADGVASAAEGVAARKQITSLLEFVDASEEQYQAELLNVLSVR